VFRSAVNEKKDKELYCFPLPTDAVSPPMPRCDDAEKGDALLNSVSGRTSTRFGASSCAAHARSALRS